MAGLAGVGVFGRKFRRNPFVSRRWKPFHPADGQVIDLLLKRVTSN